MHLVIGVCPQFSVQWESLTVREHLLFYARLKGVPRKDENSHVDRYLRDFGLLSVANRLSSNLSGGMQRRLSVAIALVGDSEIVFMDEPVRLFNLTDNRQQVWILPLVDSCGELSKQQRKDVLLFSRLIRWKKQNCFALESELSLKAK